MNAYWLGLYEKAMPEALSLQEKLLLTRASGFDHMELSIDESDAKLARLYASAQEVGRMRRAICDTGVPIRTICLSGHRKYPLGAHDERTRAKALDIMERALRLASELGVRIVQLAGYDVYYETGDAETARWFLSNLRQAAVMAARQGVLLGFETMETPFMDTVGKAMRYVKEVNSPYLGVFPDIGNLKNAAALYGTDVTADIRTGRGHVVAAHLKETRPGQYRDLRFGQGHTEYLPCIRELLTQGVRLFTGEFWDHNEPEYEGILTSAAAFLRARIEEAYSSLLPENVSK